MRQLIKIFIIVTILYCTIIPSFSALSGGVDYNIPIDYTKLNKSEIEIRADMYYNLALKTKKLDDNMTSALNLYSILTNIEPDNIYYTLRLGKLYDVLGKNRYAKGNYYHAMGIDKSRPEPYYYLGDYFYDREQYRDALKFYKKAFERGYENHYQTLYKIGNIYEKFGDTQNAISILQKALSIDYNDNLADKLNKIEDLDNTNKEYYRK